MAFLRLVWAFIPEEEDMDLVAMEEDTEVDTEVGLDLEVVLEDVEDQVEDLSET